MRILVVDDSAAMRMLVIRTLRQIGVASEDVEQAADGRAALEAIRSHCPDLVLADWNMPNMTGIELLEALRDEDIGVTFGFITAESSALMRKRANDAGAQFLIAKPFGVDAIRKAVGELAC